MLKKIARLLFIGILIFTLFGCSNGDKEKELALKEKELALKEKELAIKEKELEMEQKSQGTEVLAIQNEQAEPVKDEKLVNPEKVTLSLNQQKEINIFLSNFTEVFFEDFTKTPSNQALIDFGVRHNDINNFELLTIKENNGYLNKSHVERSIKRFFGLIVKHQKTDQYGFDGKNYIIQLADGELLPMAVVTQMYDNKDGTYTVYFDEVYDQSEMLGYDTTPAKLKEAMKKVPQEIEIGDHMKAIVSRHDFEGKSLYKLLEYVKQ